MTLKEPIVEGAYYLLDTIAGYVAQAIARVEFFSYGQRASFTIGGHGYSVDGKPCPGSPRIVRRVYLVPTDPAEVVAELRERETEANRLTAAKPYSSAYYHGREDAFSEAADLVESMLGLARCGEGCDGNCELTTSGPTKAEAELAELRAKTAEVIAELKTEVADLARHNRNEYIRDRSEALTHAADLVAEKLGVK